MKWDKSILVHFFLFIGLAGMGQVGIMTTDPDPSSAVDISATNKGLLVPRVILTTDLTDPSPVNEPADGLLVFNVGRNQTQGFYYWTGAAWALIKSPSADTLIGPQTSTDNAIVRFDGNSGKLLQNSVVILDDDGNISNVNHLTANQIAITTNPLQNHVLVSDNTGNASWQQEASIAVEKNDTLVMANINKLNFEGGINVQSISPDKSTVTFYKNSVSRNLIHLSSPDSINLNNLLTPVAIPWNTEVYFDHATYIHSATVNPGRVTVRTKGLYEINFRFSAINKTVTRKTVRVRVRKNGNYYFPNIASYAFSYQSADLQISHVSSSFLIELESNDYIELMSNGQTNNGNLNLIPNENIFYVRLIRLL